ncbi:MAG: glycosyltransferase family 39 protein [Candidatus Riflebacteria bacterium]|nr:glycosyltransferase family 39 protein [Candidatus Riflebacteria bacterium]
MKQEEKFFLAVFTALFCLFGYLFINFGIVCNDEGWYLKAAELTKGGKIPYRDFPFPQMPLLPLIYSIFFHFVPASILSGRFFSMVISLLNIPLFFFIGKRSCGKTTGIFLAGFFVLNFCLLSDLCSVKTQALTVLFSTLSLLFVFREKKMTSQNAILSLFFMALAFYSRLTLLIAHVGLLLFFLRVFEEKRQKFQILIFGAVPVLIFLFLFLLYPKFSFGVFFFHLWYYSTYHLSLDTISIFWIDVIKNHLGSTLLFLFSTYLFFKRIQKQHFIDEIDRKLFVVFLCWLGMTLLHTFRIPAYVTHQNSIFAFETLFIGIILGREFTVSESSFLKNRMLLFLLLILSLTNLYNEKKLFFNQVGGIAKLEEVSQKLKQSISNGDLVFTLNNEIALNGNYKTPDGYELGVFSFFPDMNNEEASFYKLTNFSKLLKDLSNKDLKAICLTDNDFHILSLGETRMKNIQEIIQSGFIKIGNIKEFGQYLDDMQIYVKK